MVLLRDYRLDSPCCGASPSPVGSSNGTVSAKAALSYFVLRFNHGQHGQSLCITMSKVGKAPSKCLGKE